MASNAFNVIVVAIVAAALISIIILEFGPQFLAKPDVEAEIARGIDFAELNVEKTNSLGTVLFSKGLSLNASNFDSKGRTVSFKCNSSECDYRTKGTARTISFESDLGIKTFARCNYDYGLSVCTLYLGKSPAQATLEVQGASEIDLSKGNAFEVQAKATNSGETDSGEIVISVRFYRELDSGNELEDSGIERILTLKAGETATKTFFLKAGSAGNHKIVITAEGKDAGKDKIEKAVYVNNSAPSNCSAGNSDSYSILDQESGKCRTRLYCSNCGYGLECSQAWQAKLLNAAIEVGDKSTAYKITSTANGACT
ncbi:MAG: hypothetical protein WC602_02640 [archaeon]